MLLYGLLALGVSLAVTPLVRRWAVRIGAVDDPARSPERKLHARPTPLLGGFAVAAGIAAAIAVAALHPARPLAAFPLPALLGVGGGVLLLLLGGFLDDRWNLPARVQLLFPLGAALAVVLGGTAIGFITNPFGGVVRFDTWTLPLPWLPAGLPIVGAALTVLWLLATTFAAKLLDGLDGLVTGVGAIGSTALVGLALRPPVNQPETALLAAAVAGACLGFLPWNWNPARIFLGEAGATVIGFSLGVLAVISGGKIATALLILGLPILDVVWVVLRRALSERRSPFSTADRKHLHHRLLATGLSQRGAVLLLWTFTAAFGALAVLTRGTAKVAALSGVVLVMLVLAGTLGRRTRPPEARQ